MKIRKNDLIYIAALIVLAIGLRILKIAPNVELVTGASLAAGFFLKNTKISFAVPFLIMMISDLIIGNTRIFLFTWSAFFVMPFFSSFISKKFREKKSITQILFVSQGMGIISTLLFFLWTNFGVVMIADSYSKDISGVLQSYINGLPFLANQLAGNLILVPVIFAGSFIYFGYRNLQNSILNKQLSSSV
jgi:hypothetical protein